MARLLHQAAARGITPDTTGRLLAAVPVAESAPAVSPQTRSDQAGLVEPLSERELEVLQLIAEGHSNRSMSDLLGLSIKTVDGHRTSLMSKLGLHDRTEVVKYALHRQLIDL